MTSSYCSWHLENSAGPQFSFTLAITHRMLCSVLAVVTGLEILWY